VVFVLILSSCFRASDGFWLVKIMFLSVILVVWPHLKHLKLFIARVSWWWPQVHLTIFQAIFAFTPPRWLVCVFYKLPASLGIGLLGWIFDAFLGLS